MPTQPLTISQEKALKAISELCAKDGYALRVTLAQRRGVNFSSIRVLLKRGLIEYIGDNDGIYFNCDYYRLTQLAICSIRQTLELS